eukprot:Skav233137  [mRNA]  locus=scaffold792:231133:232065:+ [translate_table: standard]
MPLNRCFALALSDTAKRGCNPSRSSFVPPRGLRLKNMGTEAMFGLTGKDFVILAADGQAAYSIIRLKNDADKIWKDLRGQVWGCCLSPSNW